MNKPIQIPLNYLRPTADQQASPHGETSLSPRRQNVMATLRLIYARKWLVLLTALILVAAAFAFVRAVPPTYRASATLLIESPRTKIVTIDDLSGGTVTGSDSFVTQAEFLRSRDVAVRVIRNLGLLDNKWFDHRQQSGSLGQHLSGLITTLTGRGTNTSPGSELEAREAWAVEQFQRRLDVEPVRASQLIRIRFDLPDPALAASIANNVASAFIRSDLDARFRFQQEASKWLTERLDELRVNLEASEADLQSYREQAGIVDTSTASMGGNTRQLDAASEQLVQARVTRSQLGLTFRQTRPGEKNRYQVPAVFNSPGVMAARESEVRAETRLAEATRLYGTSHPAFLAARSEADAARRNTASQAEAVIDTIAKQYEAAQNAERALEASLAESRGSISDINRKQLGLSVLEREVATNKQLYQTFLARAKETSATSDYSQPVARIVDPAITPVDPFNPWKNRVLLLAALGGLALGAMLGLFLERQSEAIKSTDDVEDKLQVPLLAAVPMTKSQPNRDLSLTQALASKSPFAEAIRTAMTGVRLSTLDLKCPVIMFTSSVAGEGKTTAAIAFAIEQARSRRVVLIDADLRKPTILPKLGRSFEKRGLLDAVRGKDLNACLQFSRSLNLSILGARPSRRNPLDTLLSPAFPQIIEHLRQHFDMVIIDSPPIELVSDATVIASECDAAIYLVKASSTPVPIVRRGLGRLQGTKARLLGVILNAHDFETASRYYGDSAAQGRYNYGVS